ncbi:MAG: CRISPR-associated protein [Deltaproteobacteria bacterium]|nr:CRISPR-associated protein [Deltaproteobacteria bacterium]
MRKYQHAVITAGTSLLAPSNAYGKLARALPQLRFAGPRALPAEGLSPEQATDAFVEAASASERLHGPAPLQVSAEYSMLHALRRNQRLAPHPTVTLIHTATFDGALAARWVKVLIEEDFDATVTLRPVEDFNVSDRARLKQGIGAFMAAVATALDGREPTSTCFAPIGGYKVMTSMGYLAGAWLGYPTAYLHESGDQILHEIPAVPIRLHEEELATLAPLLHKTNAVPRWSSLSDGERDLVERYRWLFDVEHLDDEAYVSANPFALFLMGRPDLRHLFAPKILLSPDAAARVAGAHAQGLARRQLTTLLERLLQHPSDADLHHEWFPTRDGWSLYKGSIKPVFRALYRLKGHRLEVAQVWLVHKTDTQYEPPQPEEVLSSLSARLDTTRWEDWTERVYRP